MGHLAFTPISALFEGANEIPVLGSVSRLISLPFVAVGEGGSAISGKIVDELPIPDKDKENIKQGVQEITALAAQLALGKITHIGGKKIKELKTKFGEKDGQTIADKAQEFAEQAKEPVPEAPKIAPVAQKGLPEAITAEKGIIGYHGTNKEFIDFKSDIPGSTYYGQGSYFTNVKDRALTYGKNIKEASIEFKNPYISGTKYNQKMIDELNKLFKSKKDKVFLNRIIEEKRPINSTEVGRHIIPELYKKAGYDGLIIRDGYEMVVFDKSAIKEISKGIIPKELEPFEVKPKRKYIEIPREQLPIRIEQAEKGVSALEARMKGIFETENVKRAKAEAEARGLDISIYDKMSKPEQINAAAKYVARISQKEVLEVLEGKREAPKGLLHNSIMIALEEKSLRDKNVDLAIKLASLRSTRAGQEISILTEVGELSPVSGMDAIIRARRESATKKLGEGQTLQTKKTSQIKEIKTEQTKFQMKLSEAEKLLNSIVC